MEEQATQWGTDNASTPIGAGALSREEIEQIEAQVWNLRYMDDEERAENHKFARLIAAALASAAQPAPAPAAVAGPSDAELDEVLTSIVGSDGLHTEWLQDVGRPCARAVLARWGAAPTTQAAAQGDAHWPQLRSALAMAMLGWGSRPDRTMETCYAALDAITEPGMPLALLRAAPDWRDAARAAKEGGPA